MDTLLADERTVDRTLLERVAVPSRLSLVNRSGRCLAYNPSRNIWHPVDPVQAEVLRWLRAHRPWQELPAHLQRRFELARDAADAQLRVALERLILRHLLDLENPAPVQAAPQRAPLVSVYWIATQACNLRCTYCYQEAAHKRPLELDTAEALSLVDQVKEAGASTFVITGGEPFARRDLLKIARHARSIGLQVNVITNGHYVTRTNAAELAKLFNRITVSLDHGRPEHHDKHRGAGSWRASRTAIDLLLEAGATVDLNSTLSRSGSLDLAGLLSLRDDKRIKVHRITPQFPMGRGREGGNDPLEPDELLALDDRMYQTQRGAAAARDAPAPAPQRLTKQKGTIRSHCGAGLSEVSVDPEGWVYPCRLLQTARHRGSNIRAMRLRDIVESDVAISAMRNSSADRLPQCKTCIIRNYCGGGCRGIHASLSGDALRSDPLFCAHLRRSFELQAWDSTGDVPAPRPARFGYAETSA